MQDITLIYKLKVIPNVYVLYIFVSLCVGGSKGFAMVWLQYHTVAGSYTMVVSSYTMVARGVNAR